MRHRLADYQALVVPVLVHLLVGLAVVVCLMPAYLCLVGGRALDRSVVVDHAVLVVVSDLVGDHRGARGRVVILIGLFLRRC